MNILALLLILLALVGLLVYFLLVKKGFSPEMVFGPVLKIIVLIFVLAGVAYYFLADKSIYVEIKSGNDIFYKTKIAYSDGVMQESGVFKYSSITRGVDEIDFSKQVTELLSGEAEKLCLDYQSKTIGSGRYQQLSGDLSVCVVKLGVRWLL